MTKAQKIINLAAKHPDWSTKQLGEACDCRPEYVRVALRQRAGGKKSKADRRYYEANKEVIYARCRRWVEENAEHVAAYQRDYKRKKAAEARA